MVLFNIITFTIMNNFSSAAPGDEIQMITPEEITYTEPMAGYYLATFGFENDEVGTDPDGWNVVELGGTVNVISELDGHKKIVECKRILDDATSAYNEFFAQTTGTVEFYFRTSDVTKQKSITIRNSTNIGIYLRVVDPYLTYHDGISFKNIQVITSNVWYHIRLTFNCSTNSYDIYINNVLKVDDAGFYTSVNNLSNLYFGTSGLDGDIYFDAVGYSWDPNYNIGDYLNEGLLVSYTNTTQLDWIGYSLDSQANITITGNTTIPLPENGPHNIQVFGNNTSGLYYASNLRQFIVDYYPIDILTPKNITYSELTTGHYSATYSFTDDDVFGNPDGWTVVEIGGTVNVISVLDGHNKVVECKRVNDATYTYNNFSAQTTGTVEFYFRTSNVTKQTWITIQDSTNTGIYLRVVFGDLLYHDEDSFKNVQAISSDVWYHIRLIFNCTTDSFDIYINNVLKVNDAGFYDSVEDLSSLIFGTSGVDVDIYFDAVGYSWDPNYNIGDNLVDLKGYYPATYGFENETDGISPTNWTIYEGGGSVRIVAESHNHNKVLEINDLTGDQSIAYNNFTSRESGTVEFWVKSDDVTEDFYMRLYGDSNASVYFMINDDNFGYGYNSSYYSELSSTIYDDTWYHIRIDLECGTGNYMGLAQDTYRVFIDGNEYGPCLFWTNSSKINRFQLSTASAATTTTSYVDAVSYSWDPYYNIGDNLNEGLLVSYTNTTQLDWVGYSVDGKANITISGNTTIPMPQDGLHTIQVFGNNTSGSYYSSNIRQFTIDFLTPYLLLPPNIYYFEGETGNYIIWAAIDMNPAIYTIRINGSDESSGQWTSNTPILINIDGLSPGIYVYEFEVSDQAGHITIDTVTVTVYPIEEEPTIPFGFEWILFSIISIIGLLVYVKKRIKF